MYSLCSYFDIRVQNNYKKEILRTQLWEFCFLLRYWSYNKLAVVANGYWWMLGFHNRTNHSSLLSLPLSISLYLRLIRHAQRRKCNDLSLRLEGGDNMRWDIRRQQSSCKKTVGPTQALTRLVPFSLMPPLWGPYNPRAVSLSSSPFLPIRTGSADAVRSVVTGEIEVAAVSFWLGSRKRSWELFILRRDDAVHSDRLICIRPAESIVRISAPMTIDYWIQLSHFVVALSQWSHTFFTIDYWLFILLQNHHALDIYFLHCVFHFSSHLFVFFRIFFCWINQHEYHYKQNSE